MEEDKLYPILPGMIRKPNNLEEGTQDVEKLLDKNNQLLKRIGDLEHRVRMLEILIESKYDTMTPKNYFMKQEHLTKPHHPEFHIEQDELQLPRPQMELTKRSNSSKKYTNVGRMGGL